MRNTAALLGYRPTSIFFVMFDAYTPKYYTALERWCRGETLDKCCLDYSEYPGPNASPVQNLEGIG